MSAMPKEYMREWRAAERRVLMKAGLCIECRQQPPGIGRRGYPVQRCPECHERTIERLRDYKKRQREQAA